MDEKEAMSKGRPPVKNGKPAEELAMMPKVGWGSEDKVDHEAEDEHCGLGACKPAFLQRFSSIWTFTILVGLTSVGSEFMHLYLKSQGHMLRRQYELDASTITGMTYSSEIACLVTAVFLSIFARRIHIPRVLAITSAVCAVAGFLCIVPFLATKGDLVPGPKVAKNETYSLEKFMMLAPLCDGGPRQYYAPAVTTQRQLPTTTSTTTPEPTTTTTTDPPTTPVMTSYRLLDFQKLRTHPVYPQLLVISRQMNLDLDQLASMDQDEQLQYLKALTPEVKAFLPTMEVMLGPDADSYYKNILVPETFLERGKKSEPSDVETVEIPDFVKLAARPNYQTLVAMFRPLNLDLEKAQAMDQDAQAQYFQNLWRDNREAMTSLKQLLGPNADSYFINVKAPSGGAATMEIPDFKKLATHPKYNLLVMMSKPLNVDLKGLAKMDEEDQIKYVEKLPKDVRDMLRGFKAMLGPYAESYFKRVPVPSTPAETTVEIPDFEKLATHPKWPTLVTMSKSLNIDLEGLAKMELDDQLKYLETLPQHVRDMLPQLKTMLGPDADSYFKHVKIPTTSEPLTPAETTIEIPDFEKLATHPKWPTLVTMSKSLNIDLEGLAKMELDDQLKYLETLPQHVRDMLPQLKTMLGPDADSYFKHVKIPTTSEPLTPAETTIEIPDFEKLATHPKWPTLVTMSKSLNIDLEGLAKMELDDQLKYLETLPQHVRDMLPQLKTMLGPDADSYFKHVKIPTTSEPLTPAETTIEIPDFEKLATHPKWPTLVTMSKSLNIDLEGLAKMELDDQLKYLETLPPHVRDMLPQLKTMLGPDADSYFIHVKVPSEKVPDRVVDKGDGEEPAVTEAPSQPSGSGSAGETTVEIPDFKKLTTHPKYPMLVTVSKNFNIDLEALAEMELEEQIEYLQELPPSIRNMLPQLKKVLGANADSYFIEVKVKSKAPEMTVEIPDFKKLSTHPKFPMLSTVAKSMNIDMEGLVDMELEEQIEYLQTLPPHVRDMLPKLKAVLGADADSYFIHVTIKGESQSESSGAPMCMSMSREVFEGVYANMCPFNTGPFVVNSSTGVLGLFNAAMVLQGVARAPRMAYGVTFLGDNTKEAMTVLHLAVLYGVTFLGPIISILLGFAVNLVYITDQDVGYMTFFNPRWLAAWWLGFVILIVLIIIFAVPLVFFPRRLKGRPTKKYATRETCFNIVDYFKELVRSLGRLVINPLYLSLLAGHLLSAFVWTGLSAVLITYVTHQFSLRPIIPGMILLIIFMVIGVIGIFVGGIVASKFHFSSQGNLKFAFGLACLLIVTHLFHLGFGCEQPSIDRGNSLMPDHHNSSCGCMCQCIDHVFMPSCGSDGRTYASPCHGGCTKAFDGTFHDCQCVADDVQKMTPGYCPSCDFFYPFAVVFCIGGLLAGLQFAPLLLATFRGVKPKDVPVAIGVRTVLLIALVVLPSPLVYTAIQDAHCVSDMPECGILNPCVLYDIEPFRYKLFGLSFGVEVLGALCLLLGVFLGKKSAPVYSEHKSYRE